MRFPALMCGLVAASLCFGSVAEGAAKSRSKTKTTTTTKQKAKKGSKKGKSASPDPAVSSEPAIAPLTPPKKKSAGPAIAPLAAPASKSTEPAIAPLTKSEPSAPAIAPLVAPEAPATAATSTPESRSIEAFGSAAAPAPVADLTPQPEPSPVVAPLVSKPADPGPERARWYITPRLGVGTTTEPDVGESTETFGFGLTLEYGFTDDASLMLSARDQLFRRDYLTSRPDLAQQGAARTSLDEQKLSGELLFAYELPGLFGFEQPWLRLAVLVGPSGRFFFNDALRSQAAGLAAGLRTSFAFSDQLDLRVQGLYGYNLLQHIVKDEVQLNAMGGPLAYATYGASLGMRLAPGTRFGIGYDGEIVVLEKSMRLFHSLAFVFDVAL